MFFRILRYIIDVFTISVPESYKAEFNIHIDRINTARAKITALCFVAVETSVVLITLVIKSGYHSQKPGIYYQVMHLAYLAVMLVYLALFFRLGKNVPAHGKAIGIAGVLFTSMILAWCAGISLLDQLISGQVIVYTVAVMAIAVTPLFRPLVLTSMYAAVHVAFLLLMPHFQKSYVILYGNYVNSTTFVIICLAISYMRYKKAIEDFNNRKLIQEKNSELERINRELEEANLKLEKMSRTDSLSGVSNRYMFDNTIKAEWNRCKRNLVPLSLIMIDIDYFKTYNDSHGHLVGDDCIKQVASILAIFAKRSSDLVARYGGDEFALVLPYMGKESALSLAEQIREKIGESGISSMDAVSRETLTISAGVNSVIPANHMSLEKFIQDTDAALYKAKESRNSIFMAAACSEDPSSCQSYDVKEENRTIG